MRLTQAGKLVRAVRTSRGRQALRLGVAATGEHQPILARLAPRTVIDVGANRGQFALDVESVLPEATVISFEPLAEPADVYRRLFTDNPRYSIHHCALGSSGGAATLHVSGQDDSSSLLTIGAGQVALFPDTAERSTQSVRVETLDAMVEPDGLEEPALLKIDVQGYELEVLRGAERTLPKVRWVYVECSFQELYDGQPLAGEVVRWLQENGYMLTGIGSVMSGPGGVVQADLLFEREAAVDRSLGRSGCSPM